MDILEQTPQILAELERLTGRPAVYVDFEYNRSAEPQLHLVSCANMASCDAQGPIPVGAGIPFSSWLLDDSVHTNILYNLFIHYRDVKNCIFVAYNVAAEGRSFLAMGLDPHAFDWVDLYAEWRQLTFNNHACQYGTYYTETGYKMRSVPPSYNKARNKGRNNNAVGFSLTACIGQMFEVFVDSMHKTEMRNLIISDLPEYSAEQQKAILDYGETDIKYLPAIWLKQIRHLKTLTGMQVDQIIRVQLKRGAFMASTAKMEQVGIPVNLEKIKALRHNFEPARDALITELITNHHPFYVREKKTAKDFFGGMGGQIRQLSGVCDTGRAGR